MSRLSEAFQRRVMGPGGLDLLRRLSYFEPTSAEMSELATRHVALFDGDLPTRRVPPFPHSMQVYRDAAGNLPPGRYRDNFSTLPDYANPRPLAVTDTGVTYMPNGVAWTRGAAREDYSCGRIAKAERLFPFPKRGASERIPEGTLIQCHHAQTWGDFLCEQIKTLALYAHRGFDFPEPVILPSAYGKRGYVRPQLERLGIRCKFADTPISIDRATILLKQSYSLNWTPEDVAAVCAAHDVVPVSPEPNSIVYLSRQGVKSELRTSRSYDSEQTSRIVKEMGGHVIETASTDFDGYTRCASQADIVIADHGAAILNIVQWRPRVVIEIFAENWWDPIFTQLGVTLGVEDHVTIRGDGLSEDALREKLTYHVDRLRR